jgi:tetratricopeptide (TPR) repeat protein
MLPFTKSVAKTLHAKDGLVIQNRLEEDYLGPSRIVEADLAKLPIVDMATGTLSLPIDSAGTQGPPPAPESLKLALPEDRERVNDLAIAYLLQGDPDRARDLFETVTRIDPSYADGFVNVARAAIERQQWDDANAALDRALALKPGLPKARFFRGMVLRNSPGGDFAGAEAEFRAVLEAFPRDRESHRRLADVLFQQDEYEECLAVVDSMLKIDPEDQETWYWAMRCWQAKGDKVREAAAQAAHDKFRPDEDAQNRRGADLLDDPNLHNLAQRIHVHEQPGLKSP